MKSVITVIGKDCVGIIAEVSAQCSKYNINIIDITQKVFDNMFAMIMIVDITEINVPFSEFVQIMNKLGSGLGLSIHTQHEDIFNSMHRI